MFSTLPIAASLLLSLASTSVVASPTGPGHHAAASLTSLSHLPIDLDTAARRSLADEIVSSEQLDARYYGDSRNFTKPPPRPTKRATTLPTGWTSEGCVAEGTTGRAIVGTSFSDYSLTTEMCLNYCLSAGFSVAGTEYSGECYCGNSDTSNGGGGSSSGCTMECIGDSSEICGGNYALSVYTYTSSSSSACATTSATASAVASSAYSSAYASSVYASSTSTSSAAVPSTTATSANTEWEALGCFYDNPADNSGKNILTGYSLTDSPSMTTEYCQNLCDSKGYNFAGTEYGQECWCGDLNASEVAALTSNAPWCNVACTGNSSETCGGGWSLQLYELIDVGDC